MSLEFVIDDCVDSENHCDAGNNETSNDSNLVATFKLGDVMSIGWAAKAENVAFWCARIILVEVFETGALNCRFSFVSRHSSELLDLCLTEIIIVAFWLIISTTGKIY